MFRGGKEAFAQRGKQWDTFHRWQNSRLDISLSIEDRIAWYAAAFRFASTYSCKQDAGDLKTRIKDLRSTRERLAGLKPTPDDV